MNIAGKINQICLYSISNKPYYNDTHHISCITKNYRNSEEKGAAGQWYILFWYLFLSPSFGLLIVNLQSDARKEFKGSIARRTPQAWNTPHILTVKAVN
jgi:hypothetical protein